MIPLGPVVARSRTKAPRAVVWTYLTDSSLRGQWWPPLRIGEGIGGVVSTTRGLGSGADWTDGSDGTGNADASPETRERELVGEVDVWVSGHALGFSWREPGDERSTAVLMTLRSQGHFTGVTVTETGFDAFADGAARAAIAGHNWNKFVDALAEAALVELPEPASQAAAAGLAVGELDVDGTIEVAPLELDGELGDAPFAGGGADDIEIELEAEPGVGDHLELVTGPIELPSEALSFSEDQNLENVTPLVLPEATAAETAQAAAADGSAATSSASATGSDLDADTDADTDGTLAFEELGLLDSGSTQGHDDDPEEPDFDTLLRGH